MAEPKSSFGQGSIMCGSEKIAICSSATGHLAMKGKRLVMVLKFAKLFLLRSKTFAQACLDKTEVCGFCF